MEKYIEEKEESKQDKILSAVLTIQGEVTILKGQMKTMQGQIGTMQGQIGTIQKHMDQKFAEIDKRFDKIENKIDKMDKDHKEFKENLNIALDRNFGLRDKTIQRHTKEIKKLQNRPTLVSCLRAKLKKFVSKPN